MVSITLAMDAATGAVTRFVVMISLTLLDSMDHLPEIAGRLEAPGALGFGQHYITSFALGNRKARHFKIVDRIAGWLGAMLDFLCFQGGQ